MTLNGTQVPLLRIVFSVVFFYALLLLSVLFMSLYRLLYLPGVAHYICGAYIETECLSYVADQLASNSHWQAIQLFFYLLLSLILWPIFKRARGQVIINLGVVSLLVSGLLLLSVEKIGPELIAAFIGPLIIATLILYRRKRSIVFNNEK